MAATETTTAFMDSVFIGKGLAIGDIDLTKPYYDQGTYWGRLLHFRDVTNPRNAITTDTAIHEAEALVNKVVKREPGWQTVGVEEAWSAQKLVSSAIGANGLIPWPLRFSAFVPMNMLTLFCMLHPSQQTPVRGMFWQWWNQTYNSGVNFANRGGTGEVDYGSLSASYCLAVGISCSVSFMGSKFVARMGTALPGPLRLLVPYIAVASASIANVAMVRRNDFQDGMQVQDLETGEELGVSKLAGRSAVSQVAVSRMLAPLPLMTVPPPLTNFLCTRVPFIKARRARLENAINMGVIVGLLMIAVPACIAVYPQETVMEVELLEPEFKHRTNSLGKPVTHVKFNKGL